MPKPKKKDPIATVDEIRENMARNDRLNEFRANAPMPQFRVNEHIREASEVEPTAEPARIEWVVARLQTGRLDPTYIIKWEGRSAMIECRPPGAMAHARNDIRRHGERVLTRDLMEVLMRGRYPYNVSARFTDQGVMLTPDHRLSDGVQRPPRVTSCIDINDGSVYQIRYENDFYETTLHRSQVMERMQRDAYYYGDLSYGARWIEYDRIQPTERPGARTMLFRSVGHETAEGVFPGKPGAKEFIESIAPKSRWENVDW